MQSRSPDFPNRTRLRGKLRKLLGIFVIFLVVYREFIGVWLLWNIMRFYGDSCGISWVFIGML